MCLVVFKEVREFKRHGKIKKCTLQELKYSSQI